MNMRNSPTTVLLEEVLTIWVSPDVERVCEHLSLNFGERHTVCSTNLYPLISHRYRPVSGLLLLHCDGVRVRSPVYRVFVWVAYLAVTIAHCSSLTTTNT